VVCALGAALGGCGSDEREGEETIIKTRDDLLDPQTCNECHPKHFEEWSGSMHAYASKDPVFLAMNARAQRETGIGDFCVKCHAPMAVREGALADPGKIAEAPEHLQGVTCYFCHNVEAVEGEHNAPFRLSNDLTMRGAIRDPVKTGGAHRSAYSEFLDSTTPESAVACGACHDIVTPTDVHIERTFLEWRESVYGQAGTTGFSSCGKCHMTSKFDDRGVPIADPGVRSRERRHRHMFPGVDLALTQFPDMADQRDEVQDFLNFTLLADICVAQDAGSFFATVTLDNVAPGHRFPSGAAQDRRAWVEVVAYEGGTEIYRSGIVADDGRLDEVNDPDLWQLRDGAYKENGEPAHMFWDIATWKNDCADTTRIGCTIPAAGLVSNNTFDQEHVTRRYPLADGGLVPGTPDRVTVRVRIRPVGLDVLDDLIASGDLDPSIRTQMQTLDLNSRGNFTAEWTPETVNDKNAQIEGLPALCRTFALPQ